MRAWATTVTVATGVDARDLFEAIAREQVRVEFQPLVSLYTGRLVRFEALSRWTHPKLGEIEPSVFIPLAESAGSITPLTLVVLRRVAELVARMRPTHPSLQVSVNVGLSTLGWEGFFETTAEILRVSACPFDGLGLEVTEGALMPDLEGFRLTLKRFRAAGVRVDLDNFGTGYSSLGRLATIEVDALKIDRQFVMDTIGDAKREAVVRATVQLAHELGLEVVAQGVETIETWEYLRALGCDTAQGFHIARPMPESDIPAWMGSWHAGLEFAARTAVETAVLATRRRQVLIAEDEPALLEMMRSVLEDAGCDVITARNGAEALRVLEQATPAVVIVDVHMPLLGGPGVLQAIKQRGLAPITVVMTTGPIAARWAKELGATGFLAKPFGLNELLGAALFLK